MTAGKYSVTLFKELILSQYCPIAKPDLQQKPPINVQLAVMSTLTGCVKVTPTQGSP